MDFFLYFCKTKRLTEMKIGYDAKRAFRNNSGLGNYSRMVIGAMAKTQNCLLYTPSLKGRHEHYFDGLEHVRICLPKGLWKLVPSLWRSTGVRHSVKRDKVDLFHGLSHELPYGLGEGIKKVVTIHDLIVMRYPEFFKPVDRMIHRVKIRHACQVADAVVAISEQTKRDLVDLMGVGEEKIRVVYQSCDPIFWNEVSEIKKEDIRVKYNLPEKYFTCVGTFEERKNQLRVIEAMRLLPNEVGLALVGRPRGNYGHQVLAAQSNRVRVLTNADFADFPALYRNAVSSIYLSVFEGFGIPVLESMCCDCPVVTSNVSSMPEAGGDAALYADPNDCETVAAHLRRLLEDEAFRQQIIDKGRIQKLEFAPEKVTADMMAVYNDLLDN